MLQSRWEFSTLLLFSCIYYAIFLPCLKLHVAAGENFFEKNYIPLPQLPWLHHTNFILLSLFLEVYLSIL